jgi:hypothetical protein
MAGGLETKRLSSSRVLAQAIVFAELQKLTSEVTTRASVPNVPEPGNKLRNQPKKTHGSAALDMLRITEG